VQLRVLAVPEISVHPIVTANVGEVPTAVITTSQFMMYCPVGKLAELATLVDPRLDDLEPELYPMELPTSLLVPPLAVTIQS